MAKIGIIGSKGFLGSALSKVSIEYDHKIVEISRDNYPKHKTEKFDIIINAATPSKKYWASQNPFSDFMATVTLTADLIYNWNYKKLIQISSMSVNEDGTKHPYAINKKAAEIITSYKNPLIVRLSNLYGDGLRKGPLYDLLNSNKLYVDIKSEYSFISTDFVSKWIFDNLHKEGIIQVGAKDAISLSEIAKRLDLSVNWEGKIECIRSSNIEKGMPSVNDVWQFIDKYINRLNSQK